MSRKKHTPNNIKAKDSIHVVNLSSYTAPKIVENKREDWQSMEKTMTISVPNRQV